MKKLKHAYLYMALALAAAGCSESEDVVVNPNATPGEEVQFGGSLAEGALTRTIYGDPQKSDNKSYPVYWVQDDQVIITSPQCAEGFRDRTYSINVDTETQNYATDFLVKTSDTGLRWGTEATGDFYSIYPASAVKTVDTESYAKFEVNIPKAQEIILKTTTDANGKVSYNNYDAADMDACLMWAKTAQVASGTTVNLQYQPFATALRFTLQGPDDENKSVTVENVVVKATTSIAGDFYVDLSSAEKGKTLVPAMSEVNDASDEITLTAKSENDSKLTLIKGEKAQLNVFVIPQEYESVEGWTITVKLTDGAEYTVTITSTNLSKNTSLTPGEVHDLGELPCLSPNDGWDPADWMTNLHDKTYLSEVSIPGSWNSLNSDFQYSTNGTDIATQYAAGCRAFHIDTRWRVINSPAFGANFFSLSSPNVDALGCADGGDTYSNGTGDGPKVMRSGNTKFADRLNEITNKVEEGEYMVVICTFANNSYEASTSTGAYGEKGTWVKAVSDACASNENVMDASEINTETTVEEVESKVIVIVCTGDSSLSLPSGSKCLLTYLPMEQSDDFTTDGTGDSHNDLKNASNTTGLRLYATQSQITSSGNSGIAASNTDRGYAPTLTERQTVAQKILDYSKSNYQPSKDDYDHNQWLYLGLGGYTGSMTGWLTPRFTADSDGYENVTSSMDTWMQGVLDNMATEKNFFPVGIVLMNDICGTTGKALAKEIIQLNTKYEMAKKTDSSATSEAKTVKASTQPTYTNGGNAIQP